MANVSASYSEREPHDENAQSPLHATDKRVLKEIREPCAIYAVWYNWLRIHKTRRVTPAIASGLSKTLLTWEDLIALIDAEAPRPEPRGPYKERGD